MLSELQEVLKTEKAENKIKKAYELLAKIKFELLRNYDELNFIETEKVSLNEVKASVENGIVILEFDEALPCQKVDDAYANRVHWREMMNSALGKLFENFENVPNYEKAIVCVEVHKTSDNWDISNRMLNLVVNMLKGNFMPDDNITNLVIAHKGKKSDREKTVIYIGNYYTDMEKVLKMWC